MIQQPVRYAFWNINGKKQELLLNDAGILKYGNGIHYHYYMILLLTIYTKRM